MDSSALVLFSGGTDSTTLLYYVMKTLYYDKVETIFFAYGQRHIIEMRNARAIAGRLKIPFKVINIDLRQFGRSSLTTKDMDLPVIVPARNSIFLSLATAYAETRGLQDIFIGANCDDFKDFPDCRKEFIVLIGHALSVGNNIRGVFAPFVRMSKHQIVDMGKKLGVPFERTWSCYFPIDKDEKMKPCNKCHACIERNKVL